MNSSAHFFRKHSFYLPAGLAGVFVAPDIVPAVGLTAAHVARRKIGPHSLFDQIAFMINEFWRLGLSERQADAYHVFDRKHYPTDNIALTALFWAFNEFKEEYIEGAGASEKELKTLRHALEHKFVQVHEYPQPYELHIMDDRFYHISESSLKKYTLRILTLAREWIMELVYAIAIEESKNQDKENVVHLHIADYDEQWKM